MQYHKEEKIRDHYKLEEELGRGSFAIVKRAVHRTTGAKCAVKIIDRQSLGDDDEMALQLEVEILSQMDHPNVVRLTEIYDEGDVLYLVMELMGGGELFDRIVEKESYSEKEAAETIRPIVDAIRYCHEQNIIHRDLKPENLLYSSGDEKAVIKISDFGLARFVQNEFATTACGTPGYVAPEIIEGKGYGKEVDYWSIGIILYIMLCGFPPFYDDDNATLFKAISSCDYEFPAPYWDKVSDSAKELIKAILVKEPSQRLTADQIMEHPWIKGEGNSTGNLSEVPEKIKDYNAKMRLRKATRAIIAMKRLNKLIENK
mmetsp:Transcript_12525/g.21091  ORF Transcript_12525/g.21091 Transcript_12525/m.21091 type:complete len:316 (-) Transcript_12525:53-1000(-)